MDQSMSELEKEREKRIQVEKELEETTERLESLLNTLPVGVVIIDPETRQIIDINPQGLMTFGCSMDHLIGKKCTDHICPAEDGNCPILDKGQDLDRSEREIITFEGMRLPVLKSVVKTEINGKTILIECFIDISDKKRAEKELVEKEKFQAILEMAGAVCHEFNQPLQVISGYCDLLKEDADLGARAKEAIGITLQEVSRMGMLTRNLMSITTYKTKPYLDKKIIDIKSSSDFQYS